MDSKAASLLKKAVKFFFTSGIGFIMDFTAYTIMTQVFEFSVMRANFLSSLIGATFVFIVSTHKIFEKSRSALPLPVKYGAYIIYQLVLIFLVSELGDFLNGLIHTHFEFELLLRYSKLVCKVLITPLTMTCNFFVMRFISERI